MFMKKRAIMLEKRQQRFKAKKKRKLFKLPFNEGISGKHREDEKEILKLPEFMSLGKNAAETVNFLNEFRELVFNKRKNVALDFTTLKGITPAAALILVAELDRWRKKKFIRPRVVDFPRWNIDVKKLLFQMGFFKFLRVTNPPKSKDFLNKKLLSSVQFLPFWSDNTTDGRQAKDLRKTVEKKAGTIPEKKNLFKGLSEAMTNVIKHAYPKMLKKSETHLYNQWWMSGSYDSVTNHLVVLFYDQGVGIPETIGDKYPVEIIKSFFEKFGLVDNDASKIKAAMELGRSRTELPYRGKGLSDFKVFVDNVPGSTLRIISNRGELVYNSDGEEKLTHHRSSIHGTLIQWDFTLVN